MQSGTHNGFRSRVWQLVPTSSTNARKALDQSCMSTSREWSNGNCSHRSLMVAFDGHWLTTEWSSVWEAKCPMTAPWEPGGPRDRTSAARRRSICVFLRALRPVPRVRCLSPNQNAMGDISLEGQVNRPVEEDHNNKVYQSNRHPISVYSSQETPPPSRSKSRRMSLLSCRHEWKVPRAQAPKPAAHAKRDDG